MNGLSLAESLAVQTPRRNTRPIIDRCQVADIAARLEATLSRPVDVFLFTAADVVGDAQRQREAWQPDQDAWEAVIL